MYLSQIPKCPCPKSQNVFASSCKTYSTQITNVFVSNGQIYCSQNTKCICLSYKMYLSQIANFLSKISKYICLKMQNIVVLDSQMCLSEIAKCICPQQQNIFVPNYKTYVSKITKDSVTGFTHTHI